MDKLLLERPIQCRDKLENKQLNNLVLFQEWLDVYFQQSNKARNMLNLE